MNPTIMSTGNVTRPMDPNNKKRNHPTVATIAIAYTSTDTRTFQDCVLPLIAALHRVEVTEDSGPEMLLGREPVTPMQEVKVVGALDSSEMGSNPEMAV